MLLEFKAYRRNYNEELAIERMNDPLSECLMT